MARLLAPIQSIKDFVKDRELENVPRPDTHTPVLYNEYFNYCLIHHIEPATIGVLTRELRRYGYHRVSARLDDQTKKVYRYTGKKQEVCPHCEGLGLLFS